MLLILLLSICHFLADFTPLSTPEMLQAKQDGKRPHQIMLHAGTHALLMGFVCAFFTNDAKALIAAIWMQFWSHFILDVLKMKTSQQHEFFRDVKNKWFWILFGLDQLLHQLVILCMTKIILK